MPPIIELSCPNCDHAWQYKPTKPNPHRAYTPCPICNHKVRLSDAAKAILAEMAGEKQ